VRLGMTRERGTVFVPGPALGTGVRPTVGGG
jgi:hypothetical protein